MFAASRYPEGVMPMFHDPNTAIFALVIGLLGIVFEFHAPGTIFPGVAGAALVLLSAAALSHYPLNPSALTLIAISATMLVLELKIPSRGLLSVLGAILLACGISLLIDSPNPAERIHPLTVFGLVLPFALLTALLLTVASRARTNKMAAGPTTLLGQTGTIVGTRDTLRVQVAGEYWNAVSAEPLAHGTPVHITAIAGLQLTVAPLHDTMEGI